MSLVYVVQTHMRYDAKMGELVSRYDLRPAERFGRLRFILNQKQTLARVEPRQLISKMDMVLKNYTDLDYLLLIGSPVLIGWATALAAKNNGGRIQQLVWESAQQDYTVVKSCLPF